MGVTKGAGIGSEGESALYLPEKRSGVVYSVHYALTILRKRVIRNVLTHSKQRACVGLRRERVCGESAPCTGLQTRLYLSRPVLPFLPVGPCLAVATPRNRPGLIYPRGRGW